jgi:hypothetical protein
MAQKNSRNREFVLDIVYVRYDIIMMRLAIVMRKTVPLQLQLQYMLL